MRVLVVLARKPALEGLAAGKSALGLVRGLQAHGIETIVLSTNVGGGRNVEAAADLSVEIVRADELSKMRERWGRIRTPRGALGRGAFAARVHELAADVDIVHLDELDAAAAGQGLATPSVVHVHYLVELDRVAGRPWSSAAREWVEYRAAERRAVRNPWLVANSPRMASALKDLAPRSEVVVVPLSLDPAGYAEPATLAEPVAGMIGTASWPSTADALARLVKRVWPRVRELVPDARLRLAGRGLDVRSSTDSAPHELGVEWVGPVESAGDFVRSLGVMVYPVGRGSGTKIKVLEAMATGVPVVTTSVGAEGVVGADGIVVHEDDQQLAEATAALLRDRKLRLEAGASARAAFMQHHAPVAATLPLVKFYSRILG